GEHHMISATGIKDQDLAVIAEGCRINHPSVTGRGDLGPRPGGDALALFGAPDPVWGAEFANPGAVDRQRQASAGCSEADGRGEPTRIVERGEIESIVLGF